MKDISPKEQDESREYVGLKLKQLLESVKTDLGNGDDKKKKKQTPSPAPAPLPASQRYDAMKALDVYGHFKIIAGREGWNERGIRMAVERVAKITGIPEEDVVALVEHLSGQKLNWKKR